MSGKPKGHITDSVYGSALPKRLRNGSPNGHSSRLRMIEQYNIRILTEMCMSRFKWSGMPVEIDPRFIEFELFSSGLVLWGYDSYYKKHTALRGASLGFPNLYDNPTSYRTYGNGTGYPETTVTNAEVVPIWANALRRTDQDIIQVYAWRLANIERTIEINVNNARHTKIIGANANTVLGMKNLSQQIDEGIPEIVVSKDQMENLGSITALDLGVHPDQIEKLDILHTRTWSKVMGLLGIDNANQDKKERLVSSEVDANAQQVYSIKRMNLNERQKAVRKIQRRYPELSELAVDFWVDDMPESGDSSTGPDGDNGIPMMNNVGN